MSRVAEPDGFLVLGAAESVVGISDAFQPYPERRGLYRPNSVRSARPGILGMVPQRVPAAAMAAR
jgi:chemotaxis protein methyltransferase CheR